MSEEETEAETDFDADQHDERVEIPMSITPGLISVPFLVELQEISWRVALGLNCVENATEDSLNFPSVLNFKPAVDIPESLDKSKNDFKRWVITNGLRDCAEALHALLEINFSQCLLFKYAAEIGKIPSEIFEGKYVSRRKAFHKLDMRKRLESLANEFGISFEDDTIRCFRSLNRVRNCLAHRGGFVQKIDCNDGDCLKVEWATLVPIKPDGTEVEFGSPLGATELLVRKQIRSRTFAQQTYIDFTSRDFAEFLMNYFFLAQENTKKIVEYAISTGILASE